ncbi:MAG TPA: hypothetical protein DEB39_05135 [Planctomycetaceae bacterium]|nr:hypothetical protein [Planctomycetaceae bacterium]
MSFLTYSLFLGGLATASIPVLLHLLMRGKPRRIEFPALRLIKQRLETTKRNLRLKQILLLALRVALLVLMGFLLARPSVKLADWFPSLTNATGIDDTGTITSILASSFGSQDAPVTAVIVVDTSPRMEYRLENKTRLDIAKQYADWVIGRLPPNSRVAVLGGYREAAAFQVDPYAARERIERLAIEPTGRAFLDSVSEAVRLLEESKGEPSEGEQQELYLFSDLTEPGWGTEYAKTLRSSIDPPRKASIETATADVTADKNNDTGTEKRTDQSAEFAVFIVDVGIANPNDSAIAEAVLSEQTPAAMAPLRLTVDLHHYGEPEERTAELFLATNGSADNGDAAGNHGGTTLETGGFTGKADRLGSRLVRFTQGESVQQIEFVLPGLPAGIHQGLLRLDGTDALESDDLSYFSFYAHAPWKVLLVVPPMQDRRIRPETYIREVLDSAVLKREGTAPFQTAIMTVEQLERTSTKELVNDYRAVFLLDPPPLRPATWKTLADFVSRGYGVGTFLGRGATRMDRFNDATARELLGGNLLRQARAVENDLWIVPADYTHPVYTTFRPLSVAQTPWNELPVDRYWEMTDPTDQAMTLATFSDGRPAILARSLGLGRTLTMLTPVSDPPHSESGERVWNYLTDPNWVFYALIDGVARYLVGAGEQIYNFRLSQPAVVRLDTDSAPGRAFPPTCLLSVPGMKSGLRLDTDVPERTIRYPATDRVGNYRLRSGGTDEIRDSGFSVNYPKDTWNLRRVTRERLDEIFGADSYRIVTTPAEIEIGIARRRVGQELYVPVFLLLCTVFLGEYLFANFFYGKTTRSE